MRCSICYLLDIALAHFNSLKFHQLWHLDHALTAQKVILIVFSVTLFNNLQVFIPPGWQRPNFCRFKNTPSFPRALSYFHEIYTQNDTIWTLKSSLLVDVTEKSTLLWVILYVDVSFVNELCGLSHLLLYVYCPSLLENLSFLSCHTFVSFRSAVVFMEVWKSLLSYLPRLTVRPLIFSVFAEGWLL